MVLLKKNEADVYVFEDMLNKKLNCRVLVGIVLFYVCKEN